jgi:purine-binding chemotaxis protein CheW
MNESSEEERGEVFEPERIIARMRKDYWESLARPPVEETAETVSVLTFEVEGQIYAVRVLEVREIIKIPPWISKVPRSPRHLLGIANLRGQILPILDVRERARSVPLEAGRVVIFKRPGQDIGFFADRIVGLPDIRLEEVQKTRGIGGPVPDEMLEGQIEIEDDESQKMRIARLIDVDALLQSEAFAFREVQ